MAAKQNKKVFRGDVWFDNHVHSRVTEELEKQNQYFAKAHAKDTNQQLAEYVKECAWGLGYTPWPGEIIGGGYIRERFGSWNQALKAASLFCDRKQPPLKERKIYKEEYKRQAKLFKQERRDIRAEKDAAIEARAAQRAQERAAVLDRDQAWVKEHLQDTDEQLLEYVRQCAARLGHPPHAKEIEGGSYIGNRFCGWPVCLHYAGIGYPPDIQPPKSRSLNEYQKRVKSKRDAREKEWAKKHAEDTDEALLDYVRQCAAELGRSPNGKEVVGSMLLLQRFVSWGMVLTLAELPLPEGVKAPTPGSMEAYKERKAKQEVNSQS